LAAPAEADLKAEKILLQLGLRRFRQGAENQDRTLLLRILLIEDEPALGQAVREHVAATGHAVDHVLRLDDARAALRAVDYGLILLDLHLPDGLGLDLLKSLRNGGDTRPVIILTARDQIRDRISRSTTSRTRRAAMNTSYISSAIAAAACSCGRTTRRKARSKSRWCVAFQRAGEGASTRK
jgi:DNA-binding NtrC family response regulator